jgi:hypothetical protein
MQQYVNFRTERSPPANILLYKQAVTGLGGITCPACITETYAQTKE